MAASLKDADDIGAPLDLAVSGSSGLWNAAWSVSERKSIRPAHRSRLQVRRMKAASSAVGARLGDLAPLRLPSASSVRRRWRSRPTTPAPGAPWRAGRIRCTRQRCQVILSGDRGLRPHARILHAAPPDNLRNLRSLASTDVLRDLPPPTHSYPDHIGHLPPLHMASSQTYGHLLPAVKLTFSSHAHRYLLPTSLACTI